MRIRKLELSGFKSFVDPTALELSPGISAIVGPNGCGKSNLVDALRWVLGEQSASRLRGDAMEDVIFNGSAGRGPVGMAEVSLLMENDGGAENDELPEYLRDVPEILVTRRYFRSGESEYLINRRACRLKDITELFLGTGVGTRAYAMIEQGKVDQLVNARPEDIRLFIEEAAGTTRYRSRRLAAERKIERTRENLARVNDILQEIERNIALFRRMAKRAEQYRVWQQELRAVELQLARRRFDRLSAEIAEIEAAREALRRSELERVEAVTREDEEREDGRRSLAAIESELRDRQDRLFSVRNRREREAARLEMLEREEHESAERLGRIDREIELIGRRLTELRDEAARRAEELRSLRSEHSNRQGELDLRVQSAGEEEAEGARLAESLEGTKSEIVDLLAREADLRNVLASAERRSEELGARRERTLAGLGAVEREAAELDARVAQSTAEEGRLDEEISRAGAELRDLEAAVDRLRSEKSELERSYLASAAGLADTGSRLANAEEVARRYGRYQEGVRAVMQKHAEAPNGVLNLVAEVLDAPPEFEKAVAAVLGERLQYVIVRTAGDARTAIEDLKQSGAGRSSFLPVEPRAAGHRASPSTAGDAVAFSPLIDVVRVEEGYGALAESLLGDAVVVDDLEGGMALYRQNGVARTIVTRDGDVFRPNGVISGGSEAPYEEHLLAQRREIRRLRDEVEQMRTTHAAVEERKEAAARELDSVESRSATVEEALRELSVRKVAAQKDGERLREALARATAEAGRLRGESGVLEEELRSLVAEIDGARISLEDTAARRVALEEQRRALESRVAEHRAMLESRSRATTELRVELARVREKEERLAEGIEQMEAQIREVEERRADLSVERDGLRSRAGDRDRERATLGEALERSRAEEETEAGALEAGRERAAGLRERIEASEREVTRLRAEIDRVREERAGRDLAHAEKRIEREHVESGILERYQTPIAEVVVEPGEEAALESRVLELQGKVDRIDRSQIGMEAVGELAEAEQRRDFLVHQEEDLEASIADLQKTITSLNRASRDRFAETFEAVNGKFQETFPKLFRGGRASLVLTDPGNLLETGVDIHVQPPGMNLRTLSLLSGGQKALTAVSLIFSLFLHRPSPFCVLDEVDAPLDDANIDRFNQIVREMGEQSQFLLITHNKRTMEVAETLYGVTMEEPGVSRIVSVRFQRAA